MARRLLNSLDMEASLIKKAVWAIDPFETETKPSPAAQEALRQWVTRLGFVVQPVHLINTSSIDLPLEEQGSWLNRYIPTVKKAVTDYLKEIRLPEVPKFMEPNIIVERSLSVHKLVDCLIEYAVQTQAKWILASSKADPD